MLCRWFRHVDIDRFGKIVLLYGSVTGSKLLDQTLPLNLHIKSEIPTQ